VLFRMFSFFSARRPDQKQDDEAALSQLVTQVDANGRQIISKDVDPPASIGEEEEMELDFCGSVTSCFPFFGRTRKSSSSSNQTVEQTPQPSEALLPPPRPEDRNLITLVLDLDETLVHGSLHEIPSPDLIVPCVLNHQHFKVYIRKRPGVERFLAKVGLLFEVVVFTASMEQYASKVVARFDETQIVRSQLFRESCVFTQHGYVKDLSRLSRDLKRTIIIDNSQDSVMFQPNNAIVCTSFEDDPDDVELDIIGEFLEEIKDVPDVRDHLHKWELYRKNRLQDMGRESPIFNEGF